MHNGFRFNYAWAGYDNGFHSVKSLLRVIQDHSYFPSSTDVFLSFFVYIIVEDFAEVFEFLIRVDLGIAGVL